MNAGMSDLTKRMAPAIVPLKAREEEAAIKAARAHVSAGLSDHHRILGAELRINKPADGAGAPARIIGVLIADYGNRRNLEVLVDEKGNVTGVVDLRGAQPAYTTEEIQEARAIAEQDSRAARVARIEGAFVSEFGPEHAPDNARRIGLRYAAVSKGQIGRVTAHAIVDLSARKLAAFYEIPAQSGSGE